jgi:hypothetical protein
MVSTIPKCYNSLHEMAVRAINRKKILYNFDRPSCRRDFTVNLQEWLVPYLIVHIAGTFRFAAQNGHQSYK